MTVLREQIDTTLPPGEAFAFVADFENAAEWDPGVATSRRVVTASGAREPVGVGSRYELGVRMAGRVAPMEYVVRTWEPPQRVVLMGSGSGVEAVDDIRFSATPDGTRIDYTADIRLRGLMRIFAPFAGGALRSVARNARDGMQRTLDRRAAGR